MALFGAASNGVSGFVLVILLHLAVQGILILRVLYRPDREPASRLAWMVVVLSLPVVGILTYVFLGETHLGRRRLRRRAAIRARLPRVEDIPGWPSAPPDLADRHAMLFRVGRSISGFDAAAGTAAQLTAGTDATIAAMVDDIDAARDHVHLMSYIWLPDTNGTAVAQALMRAARRGVTCRALADDLGARAIIRHALWREMAAAGVRLATALPIGNPVLRTLTRRIDLRNHRKLLIVDNAIAYCGSQNCADAAFLPKAAFAPWVDAMMRFTGPVARQAQLVFAGDWMTEVPKDDLGPLVMAPLPVAQPDAGFAAQMIAHGPDDRFSAGPEMFVSTMAAARHELVMTTPYYVPVDSLQSALRAAANRGVAVTLILPARNDDLAVAGASRSYYAGLIAAGVTIREFRPGLLHAKTMTIDGEVTLIGSANMDRRSFALNFEANILLCDKAVTAAMRARQEEWLAQSTPVTAEDVAGWSVARQIWNNTLSILGPLL